MAKIDEVSAVLRAHLAEEVEAGFPRLSLTPSSGVIKFLDYFSSLAAADRESLLDSLARVGAMRFLNDLNIEFATTDPALFRYGTAMGSAPFTMGLRYHGLRMEKSLLTDPVSIQMAARTRATLDFVPRCDPPAALVSDPDPAHYHPAKAPLLRKLIDKSFKELFAREKKKLAGGETGYTAELHGTALTVWIGYGDMGLQLRYGVTIPDESKNVFVWRLAYEDLWAGSPGWDYLTEENAEASIGLLCEYVARVVRIRNGVMGLAQRPAPP
jgi:hypothetical protein